MLRLVADVNVEGHFEALVAVCQAERWRDIWLALDIEILDFGNLGLAPNTPDSAVWFAVQRAGAILVTANRNRRGPESLEGTMRRENKPDSLPIITISNPKRIKLDRDYCERAVERLLLYLMEIEQHRGAGRLYIP